MSRHAHSSLCAASEALTRGSCSALELCQEALARIARDNAALNIYWHVAEETALAAAIASDQRRARGESYHPLDGIPLSIKDNIAVAGMPWTAGMATRKDVIASEDAFVVQRLRKAGAVLLGKVSMHEAALGADNNNPHFGACHNPHKPGFTPGGSSGGSAAAVAAGMGCASIGTDSMGSCRIPAAYCGVVGMKPSTGRVSQRGLVPVSRRLDCAGPIVRFAEDLAPLYHALASLDWHDAQSRAIPLRHVESALRIGYLPVDAMPELSAEVAAGYAEAITVLGKRFALRAIARPRLELGKLRRAGLLICEAEMAHFHECDLTDRPELFSPELLAMLRFGAQLSAPKLVAADQLLDQATLAMRGLFVDLDVLLTPTTPQAAFAHGAAVPTNQADFTALANLSGACGLTLPIPRQPLPVGLHLLGPPGMDLQLMHLAGEIEAAWAGAR